MMILAVSRKAKEPASPDNAEHSENTMIERRTNGFRARKRSDQALMKYADNAQANASPDASMPICVADNPRSGPIAGIR